MGATASLLFAEHATRVLAFCPQVDLFTASIRPSRSANWMRQYKKLLLRGVLKSEAEITIHTGSWAHDVEQASIITSSSEDSDREKKIKNKTYPVNNHRLALILSEDDTLVNIVKEAFEIEFFKTLTPASSSESSLETTTTTSSQAASDFLLNSFKAF